ncbi:MAG: HlyD family secretion protein [Hyphomicrobium sp.]
MLKIDPTVTTIGMAAAMAIAIGISAGSLTANTANDGSGLASAAYADTAGGAAQPMWAASATGRVEPSGGEVRIASQLPGRIVEVLSQTNDRVEADDLLLRLDDQEIYTKIAAASAEAGVREREREEEPGEGLAQDRREAEDALATAERGLFRAREAFDTALRNLKSGTGAADGVDKARGDLTGARNTLEGARRALANVKANPDMPLETRLESSLAMARAELSAAEIALERTRVRAPGNGTVLNMIARAGETAVPSPESALLVFGDLTALRVRAEVEERDAAKVRAGQKVVVKADAFPDRSFEGVVTSISQSLGTPRIATRGPRRPNDVEVVEVMVSLDGTPPLFTGMRVDVFFKAEATATAMPEAKSN